MNRLRVIEEGARRPGAKEPDAICASSSGAAEGVAADACARRLGLNRLGGYGYAVEIIFLL